MADVLGSIPAWLDLTAIAVGASTATVVARELRGSRIDWLGIVIIGVSCGLGGGIMRDLLIGTRPAAMSNEGYLLTAVLAAIAGMLVQPLFRRYAMITQVLDAVTLAFFCGVGTAKAVSHGLPVLPSILIGAVTAVGGGVLRDMLLSMPVGIMYVGSFYAVAAVGGAAAHLAADALGADEWLGFAICLGVTFVMRMASVWFGLTLPEQMSLSRGRRRAAGQARTPYTAEELRRAGMLHGPSTSAIEIIRQNSPEPGPPREERG
ncbi:MAG: TRIC cation channel family protein [Pseudoclavibacter sp.]|nr:TRIC cation channel family protein [Pseudoclavibacter sp.]